MRRIWLEKSKIQSPEFQIDGEAYHHAIQVCRFKLGEEFEIVTGHSVAYHVRLTDINKKNARVQILSERQLPVPQAPYLNLAIASTKWNVFEEILEKSVELGVSSIQPLISDYSFIRQIGEWPKEREKRFQKIIYAATEQTGRGNLLTIMPPKTYRQFLAEINQVSGAKCLLAYEGAIGPDAALQDQLMLLQTMISEKKCNQIWAIVGSEGGFSANEIALAKGQQIDPISLGQQILRAETACLALLSIIKYGMKI